MFDNLSACPMFRGLKDEEITTILQSVEYQLKTYPKGELIAQSGDEVMNMMIIMQGSISGEMYDFTGKTIKIEDINSPYLLAPAFLFGNNNRYPVYLTANMDVTILVIPKTSLINLLQDNKLVLKNYLDIISNRAQFLSNKIRFLSFQSIKGKIAHYLLQLMERTGSEEITLPKSQSEMAEMFGVTRPSLGRAIRDLDRSNLIKASGKQVRIINKDELSLLLK